MRLSEEAVVAAERDKPVYKNGYYNSKKGRIARMLYAAHRSAISKGLPFSLTAEDLVIPERCPVLGIKILLLSGRGRLDCAPSLDRVDPSKGYTRTNTRIISERANRIKNNGTAEEHEKIARYIRENS